MPTTTSPPILIYDPVGGVPPGSVSNPPVYSQKGTTQLVVGQAYVDVVFGSIQTTDEWVLVECVVVNEIDVDPLNMWPGIITDKTASGFRLQLNGLPDSGNYYLHWAVSGVNITATPATNYLFTGPSSGDLGVPSAFTVHLPPSATLSGILTVTPNDGGAGGVFSPSSVTLSTTTASATFTYTPASYGTVTLSVTNSGTLTDPASITFLCVVTTYTLSGPSTGTVAVASTNFTVALPVGGSVTGTITVTPSDGGGGGTFTPTTVGLTTGAPSATFTYTPASTGAKTISVTNNGGLTNPGSLIYTALALPTYTLTGPSSGVVGVASTNFTVTLATTPAISGTVTVTPHDGGGGGTFTPTTVGVTDASAVATFTYTPASSGAKTISVTNDRGLTDPGNLTYTVTVVLHLLNTLISYWKLDEASGTRNDSVGTNNLTDVSGVASTTGKINNAASFIKTPLKYLSVASNSTLQVTSDFTFSFWVQVNDLTANMVILSKDTSGFASIDYLFQHVTGAGLNFNVGGATSVSTAGPATTSTWYHVVGWYDSSDQKVRLRINDSVTYTSAATATLVQTAGNFGMGATGYGEAPITGLLDEVGFWKRILTADEITGLYNGGAGLPFSSFTA